MNMLQKLKYFINYLNKYLPELIILASLAVCLYKIDLNWFNTHMGRDLFRAQHWNWLGPEMGWDYKRLPGPFYYLLLKVLSFANSIYFILLSKLIVTYFALYLLAKEIQKLFPNTIVNCFLSLFLLMPVYIFTSRNLWNPSLIILFNSLQFLFFLKFQNLPSKKFIYFSTLTAILGLQVHFSTVIAYLAFGLSIMLFKNIEKIFKKYQSFSFGLIFTWLSIWYLSDNIIQINNQIISFYGFNSYLINRIIDLSYHLTLNLIELKDYDLFTLYFKTLAELSLIDASLILAISNLLSVVYTLLFIYSLYGIVIKFLRNK